MLNKLQQAEDKYLHLEASLSDPVIAGDPARCAQIAKEYKSLTPIIEKYREFKSAQARIDDALSLLEEGDDELRALANEELREAKELVEQLKGELTIMLLPRDPNDEKNVMVEIRAGAGGEEAALFAAVLYRMYTMYAATAGFRCSLLSENPTELGGYRQLTFQVEGEGAYSRFKYESGVHRVQRVPDTESQGRIHTSTITVAVLPEAPDVDIEILEKDIKIDTYRSSGAGGQHVNKTESAIRITHLPTGIVVNCQDERSQIKNREKAMNILKSKLYDYYQTQADAEYAAARKSQVGTGDRSERIRTYNFPQGRVTDHRIGLTLYSIENFMNGDIAEMVEALRLAEQTAKLQDSDE